MATEQEVANEATTYMRAKGYVCGRNFASVPDVAKGIQARLPGETQQSIERKLREVVGISTYRFKSQGDKISASEPADPDCGRN